MGFTATEAPVTVPTPGAIARVCAPVTDQLRVLDWPEVSLVDEAVKLAIAGGVPTATVTDAVLVPKVFVAVRV